MEVNRRANFDCQLPSKPTRRSWKVVIGISPAGTRTTRPEALVWVCTIPDGRAPLGEAPVMTSTVSCAESDCASPKRRVARTTGSTTSTRPCSA